MSKLIAAGNLYLKKMDLTDVALLKLCMGSLGFLGGLWAARRNQKAAGVLASLLFLGTYIPLMGKFLSVLVQTDGED